MSFAAILGGGAAAGAEEGVNARFLQRPPHLPTNQASGKIVLSVHFQRYGPLLRYLINDSEGDDQIQTKRITYLIWTFIRGIK
jgi:hypothetical protein